MEREGTPPPVTRISCGKTSALPSASPRGRASFLGRIVRAVVAVLLVAGLLPAIPASPVVEEAEAFEGTTNYQGYFTPAQIAGKYGYVSGSVLYASSTSNSGYYINSDGAGKWLSSSAFVSTRAVAFTHDWAVNVTAQMTPLVWGTNTSDIRERVTLGLSTSKEPTKITGPQLGIILRWDKSSGSSTMLGTSYYSQGDNVGGNGSSDSVATTFNGSKSLVLSYSMATDKLTLSDGSKSVVYDGVKNLVNGSGYLTIMGEILWRNASSPNVAQVPSTKLNVSVTFNSMSLPHLSPEIKEIKMYRTGTTVPIGADEYVAPGTPVRIEAVLRNTFAAAGSEEFPFHLKLLGSTDAKYPTVGMTVSGDVATSTGQALTLKGTAETKVKFNATINGPVGSAASVGLQLIEDSFGGTYEAGAKLLNEHPLKPGDGSGSGAAGKDYHYTRLPAANANGWNNSPVTVTFYPGDFDQMELTPSEGAAAVLTGAAPAWTRSEDTAGVSLSAQAKNTSTGVLSTERAGSVKLDQTAPRLSLDPALGALTADDAADVSSGIWRLHRTGSSGVVAASARAAAYRTFSLTNGDGRPAETVAGVPNGYYVAEDAAGNLSAPLKVSSTEPPAVERPAGSVLDPSDPGAAAPVGPELGPGADPVPAPAVTEDDEGLKHAVIEESVSEMIDPAAPPFGGLLEKSEATAMMDYRFAATSTAAPLSVSDELLDASGSPIASFDTKSPGTCAVRRVITDSQGNTTTILLHYSTTRDSCPTVSPWEPVDPSDPDGPQQPGTPLEPSGAVTKDSDGTQHGEVTCEVTEAVSHGAMDANAAVALFNRHFATASAEGGTAATTVQSMQRVGGGIVTAIDLSKVADYLITYVVRDGAGNTTTVKMTYHLVSSKAPGVVATPDPGTDPNPQPGDDPLNPKPRPLDPVEPPRVDPDGTHHAVVEDEMRVPVQEGVSLSRADVEALMQRRYSFTAEGAASVNEVSLTMATLQGAAVDAIDRSHPGAFRIIYKVADASGNTTTVRLRYLVVADAPSVTPTDPDGSGDGGGNGGNGGDTPGGNPGGSEGNRDPLPPAKVTVDPETGLTHAVIEDVVTVVTNPDPMTPAAMAEMMQQRYAVKSAMPDGKLTYGTPRLFDSAGAEVAQIDRSKPGDWQVEQRIVDSAGNTTTILLRYLVREGSINGNVGGDGNNGGGNGSGIDSGGVSVSEAGPVTGSGDGDGSSRWASAIHQLPQTGGILGPCPLHILFLLIMALASAYTLMRLRQEAAERDERRRRDAEWEELVREAVR